MRSDFGAVFQAGPPSEHRDKPTRLPMACPGSLQRHVQGVETSASGDQARVPAQEPGRNRWRPVDSRVVRISQFGGFRDVAAKYWLLNASIAKEIPFNRKYFNALVPYVEYSGFYKDEAAFPGLAPHHGRHAGAPRASLALARPPYGQERHVPQRFSSEQRARVGSQPFRPLRTSNQPADSVLLLRARLLSETVFRGVPR